MHNFQTLGTVFDEVTAMIRATAVHLDWLARREAAREGRSREALLAHAIASQRSELAVTLRDFLAVAPEPVRSRWFQYTAETDGNRLLGELESTREIHDAIASLDSLDRALMNVFDMSERQDQPDTTKEACEWARQQLELDLERRASTIRTAVDV
jgi:hypothetical protein